MTILLGQIQSSGHSLFEDQLGALLLYDSFVGYADRTTVVDYSPYAFLGQYFPWSLVNRPSQTFLTYSGRDQKYSHNILRMQLFVNIM